VKGNWNRREREGRGRKNENWERKWIRREEKGKEGTGR
jgi:hypothetical protein